MVELNRMTKGETKALEKQTTRRKLELLLINESLIDEIAEK